MIVCNLCCVKNEGAGESVGIDIEVSIRGLCFKAACW